GSIAHLIVRTVVAYHKHIEGQDPAVLRKANFHSAVLSGAAATDKLFFLAANAHHDRRIGFLGQKGGNNQRDGGCYLAAKPAAGVFADENDIVRGNAQPSRNRGHSLRGALRTGINVDLAVLPV